MPNTYPTPYALRATPCTNPNARPPPYSLHPMPYARCKREETQTRATTRGRARVSMPVSTAQRKEATGEAAAAAFTRKRPRSGPTIPGIIFVSNVYLACVLVAE